MDNLTVFEFQSNEIRIILVDSEPWFVVADLVKVLEHSNTTAITASLKPREKGFSEIKTLGGSQDMAVISESGLYRILMRSNKPNAEAFQDWLAEEVLPTIRKTGSYIQPKSQAQMLLMYAQQLVEIEERQNKTEQAIAGLESSVKKIHERAEAAEQELKALPAPNKTASPRTTRSNINSLVRTYCYRNNISHSDAYKNLYREFRDRYHVDLKVRAANGKSAPLDIAESLDVLDDLYALASDLFGGNNA